MATRHTSRARHAGIRRRYGPGRTVRAVVAGMVVFILGVLVGTALNGATPDSHPAEPAPVRPVALTGAAAEPADPPRVRADPPTVPRVDPRREPHARVHPEPALAHALIGAGTASLAISTAGMVIVGRWRRRW